MTRQQTEATSGGGAAWCAWLAPLLIWGCTSVDSAADRQIAEQRLPRPARIVVHDFAVSPEEVEAGHPWSSARLVQDTARTAAETAVGHVFADEFAAALVDEIRKRGLPAARAEAQNLPSGPVLTVEGRFISLAGDPSAPAIIGFSGNAPEVLADVQLYGTDRSGEELSQEMEISLGQGGHLLPAEILPDPTITAGEAVTARPLSATAKAQLATAAKQAAAIVAGQLEPWFADQGWVARPQG